MKELTLEQMETTQGGKFWGLGGCKPTGEKTIYEHNGGAYECTEKWTCNVYAFWIAYDKRDVDAGCVW